MSEAEEFSNASTRITLRSITPQTFEFAQWSKQPRIEVGAFLFLPVRPVTPMPVVIISIGSLGLASGRETLYATALNRAGIAVLVADSFASRGFAETASDQTRLPPAAAAADTLSSLQWLASDPRFDKQRIGLLGYSRGATIALLCADKRLQVAIAGSNLRFAAHLALYPSCSPQWEHPQPTDAPILMMIGGNDELAPPPKALAYADLLKERGGRVETVIVPGAQHSFDALHPAAWRNSVNLADALIKLDEKGRMFDAATGRYSEGDWPTFYRLMAATYGRRGATTGWGPMPRDVAVSRVVDFFRAVLRPQVPEAGD